MPLKSLDKFFQDVYKSYKDQKRRDTLQDFETILKLKKVGYELNYQAKRIPQIPTIIIANHFARPLFLRKSPLTTLESMITSAVITKAAAELVGDKITWVVKNDLRENLFFLSIKLRKIQLASIYCHNFIGVAQNYPFGAFQKWLKFLKAGYSVGLYPEGLVSSQMREAKPGFAKLLDYLKSKKVVFQILPVGIYYKNSSFMAEIGYPIDPTAAGAETASKAILSIASNLPIYLQGTYRQKVEEFRTQTRQQPEGDQIQEHLEPEISAV